MTGTLPRRSVYTCITLVCAAVLAPGCAAYRPAAPVAKPKPQPMTLSAAGATAVVDGATGRVTSLRLGAAHEEMCQAHPSGSDQPFGFVEVTDLRTGRTYSPFHCDSTISDWQVTGQLDGAAVEFAQQYANAPFQVHHVLKETKAGIRWEAIIRHLPSADQPDAKHPNSDQDQNRSLQVTWVLPALAGWQFWGPNDLTARQTDGITPYRYVYGHTDYSGSSIVVPLVGLWGRLSGAAIFSPPDVRKCQIVFEVAGAHAVDMPKGAFRRAEDLQTLRVMHNMVGLRPDCQLSLAICIAGSRPDWRSVMARYVEAYPDLFEPIAQTRKCEGPFHSARAGSLDAKDIAKYREMGVTCLELQGYFPRPGEYVPADAVEDAGKAVASRSATSKPAATKPADAGLTKTRQIIKQVRDAGMCPFLYFDGQQADASLVNQRFQSDIMRSEDGRANILSEGQPALHAQADSPFGRHVIEQLNLLLKVYPEAPGYFLDDFTAQWVDFAHDDGVTTIHNRPAYDMNRNHQDFAPLYTARLHEAGKVVMAGGLATIESARGIDMVQFGAFDLPTLKALAFACPYRPLFPADSDAAPSTEKRTQYLLAWGALPAQPIAAYRPLATALIGRRWVFDPDPITLPPGYLGQIFRIDKNAPFAGDVVVSMANPQLTYKDRQLTEGLSVSIRLPDIDEFTKATWLGVERSEQKPEPCLFDRDGESMVVHLPLAGAAGILRLSR